MRTLDSVDSTFQDSVKEISARFAVVVVVDDDDDDESR